MAAGRRSAGCGRGDCRGGFAGANQVVGQYEDEVGRRSGGAAAAGREEEGQQRSGCCGGHGWGAPGCARRLAQL